MNQNKMQAHKLFFVAFTSIVLMSCTSSSIVNMDEPVKQLKNLEDYDSDGVIEAREKCADTVLGATIDNYGCGTQTPLVDPLTIDVKFVNNSYEIPESAQEKIKELADFLNKYPDVTVIIEGHTSKVGNRELNQTLSENRAEAISAVLTNNFNIAQARISSVGYGFDRLIDQGDTPSAHAVNRRIMAEVSKVKHIDDMKWTIYTVNQTL